MTMAPWMKQLPWNMIVSAAKMNDLDENLLAAIIMQETAGGSWKSRYEAEFKYLLKPVEFAIARGISEATETIHQKTSWGLMQIMGAVAREIGFRGDLPELARPGVGLKWGCIKLKTIADKYGRSSHADIAAAWNGGSVQRNASDGTYRNQKYVVAVMRYYSMLTGGVG